MTVTRRSSAKTGSRDAPLTSASALAAAWIAIPSVDLGPAREVAPGAIDLPVLQPEPRGQRRRRFAIAGDPRHGAQLRGDRGHHRHGIGARGEGMPQRDQRLAVAARDRRVGDGEGRRLDSAAVVALDDLLGDVAGDVRDQLLACRRELGEVVGECRDERTRARPARCASSRCGTRPPRSRNGRRRA